MRHLGSFVLSVLLGPLTYALCGIGLVQVSQTGHQHYLAISIGLAALVAAGVAYALLVLPRVAPIGPFLLALGYLAVSAWALFDRASFVRLVPYNALGVHGAAWAPAGTLTTLLAVPLLLTVFSPRRWRRHAYPPAAVEQYPAAEYAAAPFPGGFGETASYPAYPDAQGYEVPAHGYPTGETESTRRLP
jgi:hypothetical protein